MAAAASVLARDGEAERFVITAEAREAVIGREETILDALGIPFREGRPHVTCPYPEHGGENDWRWNDKRARAICTCSKGDTIFDVVMKVEGLNFEEAKIRCMEVVGAGGLIKVKHEREDDPDNKYQGTTAHALLNSIKPRFRDDHLPALYLAGRLGVADDEVLMPTTFVRGITHMPYWEGGATKSAKPKVIATPPAAVFQQVGADRKTHAHRIYLSPDGRAKADLGMQKNGQKRDPKKSAKKIDDNDNPNGRSVYWGNPSKAPHIIVAEGIETAAAVAFAFRAEIEAFEVAVASAISANGIEAFELWPVTKRVTVAADRDDAQKRGKPGSQRGEQAARKFALRNMEKIKVGVALPGDPGQSTDWLEIHCEKGTSAVRDGVLAAVPFVPTADEREALRSSVDRKAEIERISAAYPLPALNTKTLIYDFDRNDRVMVHKITVEKKPGHQPVELVTPVTTPFGILARLRFAEQGNSYGLRIVVQDMLGRPHNIDVERGALAKMAAADIRSMLFDAGLCTEDDGEAIAVACLKAAQPRHEIVVYRRCGWHTIDGHDAPIFLMPSGEVIGAPADIRAELQSSTRMADDVAQCGTMDGWQKAIAAACSVDGCQHWVIGTIAAFAGPIISLVGLDTCGINLSGLSSSGKSTAQRLAVSAWSTSQPGRAGLFQSARATSNAIEAMAQRANATVLSMDELAHVPGKELAKMIYTLAGGVGRSRMKADATVRDSYTWSTFVVLSAESSLEEKITSDGGEWLMGMAVRVPDVDVTGVDRNVPAATMAAINAIDQNYGHAGPEFIRRVMAAGAHRHPIALREMINSAAVELAGKGADAGILRAALPFAVLKAAGELARDTKILPDKVDVGRAISWAWGKFRHSHGAVAMSPEEQAITNLRLWIADRWGSTIRTVEADAANRESLAWYDGDAVYIPRQRLREASGGTLKEEAVARILADGGYLTKHEDRRLYTRYVPKMGKVDAYALTRAEFGKTGTERDHSMFRTFPGGRS